MVGGVGHLLNRVPAAFEATVRRAHDLGTDLVKAIGEKRNYSEQVKEHEAWRGGFARTIAVNKVNWSHNCEFWVKKGWIKP